ncbi:hypothetical protein LCGC14_1515790 [marine sediment metagenome]|uniref:Uncharacterized protein n=1 Tax=marine sediment metagenome TaxID=412755 RepID=A0A0F9LFP9_9ZZZZ
MTYDRKIDWIMKLFSLFTGYSEHRKYPDWRGYLPFYRGQCRKHGSFKNYLQSHRQNLNCPTCQKENQR